MSGVDLGILDKCKSKDVIEYGSKAPYPIELSQESPIKKLLNQATSVHCVFRHGQRYPSKSDMQVYETFYPDHKFKWNPDVASTLSGKGKEEHVRFGGILKQFTDNAIFKTTSKSRAVDSLLAFQKGAKLDPPRYDIDDKELRFFDYSLDYANRYRFGKDTAEEVLLRKATEQFSITHCEAYTYRIAAYEKTIYGSSELEPRVKRDLSFLSDVELWHKCAFGGGEVNYKIARNLLTSILEEMKSQMNGSVPERSSFRFGHAETVIPLMCLLGLISDTFGLGRAEPGKLLWCATEIACSATNVWILVDSNQQIIHLVANERLVNSMTIKDFTEFCDNAIADSEHIVLSETVITDRKRRAAFWDLTESTRK